MGGKRAAADQHEILDLLYTKETDRQAKKLARQVAKADRAAKKVPKATRPKRVKTAPAPEAVETAPAAAGPVIGAPIGVPAPTKGKAKAKPVSSAAKAAKARQTRRTAVASLAAAAAFGGYLYLTGYSLDPEVRQDRAACERITAALPEGEVTTAADAESSAAALYRLARFKMSSDLGSEVRRTGDAMLRVRTILSEGTTGSEAQAQMAALSQQVDDLRDTCSSLGS